MVKIVRAINDNVASVFYNATHSLAGYFWIGFAVGIMSLISAFYLVTLHTLVTDSCDQSVRDKESQQLKDSDDESFSERKE